MLARVGAGPCYFPCYAPLIGLLFCNRLSRFPFFLRFVRGLGIFPVIYRETAVECPVRSRHETVACAVSAFRTEVNDFERVVVWVMEIGAAAGEHALIALLLPEHIHAPGFEFRHRRVVGVAIDHEGIMNDVGKSPAARVAAKKDIAGAGFEKYEMRILFWRFRHEFKAENVGVEAAAAGEVADRNRHAYDAFGLDHTHLQQRTGVALPKKFLLR